MENNQTSNHDTTSESTEADSHADEERISILQWVLLFITLGIVAYFSPMLLSFLPK